MTNAELQAEVIRLTAESQTPGVWNVLKRTIASAGGAIQGTARTLEKGVSIVERELDNVHAMQDVRLGETLKELAPPSK